MNSYVKSKGVSMGDCISRQTEPAVKICGCGGMGCVNCGGEGYVRPRFFAGQLLTEEDLQSLSDYMVAKNRLHNRHFFGEGVVCGLNVNCQPCGDGKVIVAPGYALDCCGNDIVLSCPKELDINAMVRELRINTLGGYDCGDPCADQKNKGCGSEKKNNQEKDQKPVHRYCLYIRYCEELTDPVTPYGTDEPCVQPHCEPTRVCEGVRFELRCQKEEVAPDDLFVRIRHCFEDLVGAETTAVEAAWHQTYASQIDIANQAIKESPVPDFNQGHVDELNRATAEMAEKTDILIKMKGKSASKIDLLPALQDVLDATLDATSLVARFYSRDEKDRSKLLEEFQALQSALITTNEVFATTSEHINEELILDNLPATLDQTYALALFEAVRHLMLPQSIPAEHGRGAVLVEQPAPDRVISRYLTEKTLVTSTLLNKAAFSLNAQREWLLCRLEKSTCLTDCALREDILCIRLFDGSHNALNRGATIYSTAAVELLEALFRYLRECLCCALNPPCPPCDGTSVLLACIEVKDCKVVNICNLERTFVLTPVALRYWLPPLHLLGEVVEKLCCKPIPSKCGYGSDGEFQQSPRTYHFSRILSQNVSNLLATLFGLSKTDDVQRLVVVLGALWSLSPSVTNKFTKRELLTDFELGMKAIMSALGGGKKPGFASLLNMEIPPQEEERENLHEEIEHLKQKLSNLEARMSKHKGRKP